MILGIGTDIVCIKRFKESLKKTPTLVVRVFTDEEIAFAKQLSFSRKSLYYAKRFAAKEAISKACGTGIGADINWQDICVLNNEKGAPDVMMSPKAQCFLQKKFHVKNVQVLLSLADEKEYTVAFAILTK